MFKELFKPAFCRLSCEHCYEDWQRRLRENMSTTKVHSEDKEKDIRDNLIDFTEARLALASKEPPTGSNWLSTLKKGTRFLASKKNYPEPVLGDFLVGSDPTQMKAVFLGYDLASREGNFKFFDPVVFSQLYTLYDIIQTEVETNGNTPTISDGTVGGDGESKIIPPVHEAE